MADPPNILVIVLDSVRRDRLSCYGYDKPTSPALDSIAAEGVRFDCAYSESSWTLPVCFTLLTGLAPREHRGEDHRSLPEGVPTLPEALQHQGYATFGGSANEFFGPRCGLQRGFDEFFLAPHRVWWSRVFIRHGPQLLALTDQGGEAVTRRFLRWADRAERPWFALLWYNDVHHPYSAKWPFTTRFCDAGIPWLRRLLLFERMRRMMTLSVEANERDLRDLNGLYDGAIAYEDMLVGKLREGLERRLDWDNTLVAIAADHGDMLGERGLMGHGRTADMYDPLVRVPLILRGPTVPSAPDGSNALVQVADVAHTVSAAAGLPSPVAATSTETVDLRAAAEGGGRDHSVTERRPLAGKSLESAHRRNPAFDFTPHLCHMTAVVQDGWKLIHREDGRHELYDTREDPGEQSSRYDAEPDRAEGLTQLVDEWREGIAPHPAAAGLEVDDSEIVDKRLQDLGYF